jgi:hypothetical protein
MIRVAGILIIAGMIPVVHGLVQLDGHTATRSTFVGFPCIALGIALYLVARLRGGRIE